MTELEYLAEPLLEFGMGQRVEDPRDGLTLFGPLDTQVYGVRAAAIGTPTSLERLERWIASIQGPVLAPGNPVARPPFPGFEAALRTKWEPTPALRREIPADALNRALRLDDRHQRVHQAADLFVEPLLESLRQEETRPDVWVLVVPDMLYQVCRPHSTVEKSLRIPVERRLSPRYGRSLRNAPTLFEDINALAEAYEFEPHFHNQVKARLIGHGVAVQIVRESTIAYAEVLNAAGQPLRDLHLVVTDIAWNLATAVYYKAGGRPWKLGTVRDGVCYLGLVFKKDEQSGDARHACCAAQMFLDSGDGVVFRGAVGPWYSPEQRSFHLDARAARDVVAMATTAYQKATGRPPRELFIHGRTRFDDEEWKGFSGAVPQGTNVVGVRIQRTGSFRLFRQKKHPVLRGLMYAETPHTAYLWTSGYTPRLKTYPGREVPKPLLVDVHRGEADIKVVCQDVLALTKLNYNSCRFADGIPVTLRFADAIGEILTAGPTTEQPPLPFKFYI
ncbi:MAG: hypothetical protein EDX89_16685 [Acidobacteria bacterium]|nr:MAG: hypothetical protein EDX89_16685 [Acidobacteriota bacterium]